MDKKLTLLDYEYRPKEITIKDFEKKFIQVQGTADEWCFKVPFSDYGKTWALTKEELL